MINYIDYSIGKTFGLLFEQFKLSSFLSILISCILFGNILYLNREKKVTKYVFIGLNVICIGLALYFYLKEIFSFRYSHPFKNIYVYYLSATIYLMLISIFNKKIFKKKIGLVLYVFNIICILYSLYITIYFQNLTIIVIGNIFPEIFFGNILILINYGYMIADMIINIRR